MRPVDQLVHTRTRVRQRYALMPLEGFPVSRLPTWPDAQVKVLASPALGAQFVEYLFDIPAGKGARQVEASEQVFGYVLSGAVHVAVAGVERDLPVGGYFFVPEREKWSLTARDNSKLLLLRKRFEPSGAPRAVGPGPLLGNAADVPATPFADNPYTRLQLLIPDHVDYDFAMNIFTFDPGYGLPYVETHVMEHGLYFLEGKGLYYLGDGWMEVTADDFIWMGP